MTAFIILWSHVVAAALYGALAVFQLRRWNGDARNRPLLAAFAAMSVWTIFLSLVGPYSLMAQLAEGGRNLAFLAFMYGLMASAGGDAGKIALKGVFAAVAAVIGLQIVIGGVMPQFQHAPMVLQALASTSQIIGLTIAAGALILVHNIYGLAAPDSRSALRFPMLALAVMWAIDLHLYTVDYFLRSPTPELFAARGVLLALIVPLFALGLRNVSWRIQVSRVATFQSLSVIAILAYIITMMLAARAIEIVGGDWGRIGQVAVVLGMTLMALLVLPSARLRAWLRVMLTKHLFEHRYDYRQEWLRFTDTVGKGGGPGDEGAASLEERYRPGDFSLHRLKIITALTPNSELERRGLEHRLGLLAAEVLELGGDRLVLERKQRDGEERGVGRAGVADRKRGDRNALGHLHRREERVEALQVLGGHRHAEHRQRGVRRDHAGEVRCTAGRGDDCFHAVLLQARPDLLVRVRGQRGGHGAHHCAGRVVGEHEAVATAGARHVGLDGVHQPAHRAHDRDRAVAQAVHLVQPARLES